MFRHKPLAAAILLVTLTSCSALDILKPAPGIGVDAQIGEEANKQVIVGDQSKTEVSDNLIHGDLNQTTSKVGTEFSGDLATGSLTINNMPTRQVLTWGALIVFVLGLVFPSPFEIYRWFRGQASKIRRHNG